MVIKQILEIGQIVCTQGCDEDESSLKPKTSRFSPDLLPKIILEKLINKGLAGRPFLSTSLPVTCSGLIARRTYDLAIACFNHSGCIDVIFINHPLGKSRIKDLSLTALVNDYIG